MGYRSTICSLDYKGDLPDWFKFKYDNYIYFPRGILVVSKLGHKFYDNSFFEDYQKALNEIGFFERLNETIISVLGESGVITKVTILKDDIKYYNLSWDVESDGVHYGS